jgi:pyridoxamine-phosphate oxidase
LFKRWYREAAGAGTLLPQAAALATATRDGRPSVRMVLHRGFSRGGFVFYTNYDSRKAADLAENPRAALVFHWPQLERQVRVEGRVEKISRAESARYFQTRPRDSRISRHKVRQFRAARSWKKHLPAHSSGSAIDEFHVRRSGEAFELSQVVSSSGRGSRIVCTIV